MDGISWRNLLGWSGDRTPLWSQVRAAQLGTILRFYPLIGVSAAMQVAVLVLGFVGTEQLTIVASWAGLILSLLGMRLLRWNAARKSGPLQEASPELLRTAVFHATFMALAWGGMLVYLFPRSEGPLQMLVACMHMGLMGGGALIFASVPLAAFTYVGVLTLAMLVNEAQQAQGLPGLVYPISLLYALTIVCCVLSHSRNLVSRVLAEARVREQGETVSLLLHDYELHGANWLWETDAEHRLTRVSTRLETVAGRPADTMLGLRLTSAFGDDGEADLEGLYARQLDEQLASRRPFREIPLPVQVAGETRWWSFTATPRFDDAEVFAGYRGFGLDVTEFRRSQQQLAFMARYDALTGLGNRSTVHESLADALATATRHGNGCALLLIDLDRFKFVNDTLGHPAGDELLRQCSARIEAEAGVAARVGRLGGDEFAIVLSGVSETAAVDDLARRLIHAISQPYVIDGTPVRVGASAGVAFGPVDGRTVEDLLRAADLALYQAKDAGRGIWRGYEKSMHEAVQERRSIEMDLRSALGTDQLWLAFQPLVAASTEEIVGFEALLRWTHPVLGEIPPSKFIPVAEDSGIIDPLGEWVIRQACKTAAHWPSHLRIAVNLSPRQLDNPRLPGIVLHTLATTRLAPHRLELEVTENVFLNETPTTASSLGQLSAMGVHLSLDDFGTGYSSLGYLRKAAFSTIKIDRSFVQAASSAGGDGAAIIKSIVVLANSLGMRTVAEGVESPAQAAALRSFGCTELQGFHFSRPMKAEEATRAVLPSYYLAAASIASRASPS